MTTITMDAQHVIDVCDTLINAKLIEHETVYHSYKGKFGYPVKSLFGLVSRPAEHNDIIFRARGSSWSSCKLDHIVCDIGQFERLKRHAKIAINHDSGKITIDSGWFWVFNRYDELMKESKDDCPRPH